MIEHYDVVWSMYPTPLSVIRLTCCILFWICETLVNLACKNSNQTQNVFWLWIGSADCTLCHRNL